MTARLYRSMGCRVAGLIVLALLGGCHRRAATTLPVLPVGGDFSLTDDDNQRFDLTSLRGKAVLIFFGYTSCPDACPTTLSKLAQVYQQLGSDAGRVKTVYISVDPDRDTPAVMKADLSSFRVDAVGLTGTKAQIDKVVALYGASYEIIPTPDSYAKYTVAHSTTLYALDTEGRTRILFPYEASVDQIVGGIKAILAAKDSSA
jgi:protein SCO1/2